MVALTGIECANIRCSSVQLGLSVCKYVQFVSEEPARRRYRSATLSLGCHLKPRFLRLAGPPSGTMHRTSHRAEHFGESLAANRKVGVRVPSGEPNTPGSNSLLVWLAVGSANPSEMATFEGIFLSGLEAEPPAWCPEIGRAHV